MGQVVGLCPVSQKLVYVGMSTDSETYKAIIVRSFTIEPCPECGGTHTWEQKDTWVDDCLSDGQS